jgi:hypothetical protein
MVGRVTAASWTLDELAARAHAALAAAARTGDYAGAPNGRVRGIPDRRAIRWYATVGLLDRPAGMRGRTALYGPRHLLQLVAIKRRQAQGRSLAEIQAELVGATDATLGAVAEVPDELMHAEAAPVRAAVTARFWTTPPAAPREAAPPSGGPLLSGVPLPGGAVLLVPGTPADHDVSAIHAAAGPLLDLLADRGLLNPSVEGARDDHRPH